MESSSHRQRRRGRSRPPPARARRSARSPRRWLEGQGSHVRRSAKSQNEIRIDPLIRRRGDQGTGPANLGDVAAELESDLARLEHLQPRRLPRGRTRAADRLRGQDPELQIGQLELLAPAPRQEGQLVKRQGPAGLRRDHEIKTSRGRRLCAANQLVDRHIAAIAPEGLNTSERRPNAPAGADHPARRRRSRVIPAGCDAGVRVDRCQPAEDEVDLISARADRRSWRAAGCLVNGSSTASGRVELGLGAHQGDAGRSPARSASASAVSRPAIPPPAIRMRAPRGRSSPFISRGIT